VIGFIVRALMESSAREMDGTKKKSAIFENRTIGANSCVLLGVYQCVA
jgi:hypothetical protein